MRVSPATISFLFITAIIVALNGASVAGIPQPSPYHSPSASIFQKVNSSAPAEGTRDFDVLSYDLDITLNPNPGTIAGWVDIGVQSLRNDLQLIHLDLVSNLECLEITNNQANLFFEHRGDSLLVHLNSVLSESQTDTLRVFYEGRTRAHGSFYAGLMFRKHTAGTINDPSDDFTCIASVSETWSAHSWWPCKDHPSDKALVSLTATVPDSLSLVSNGSLISVESNQAGWDTYHWRENFPLPTYLVSVAASNYVGWNEHCLVSSSPSTDQNIVLGFQVFPHDLEDAANDLAQTCDAMEFMVNLAGPYPFEGEKYDQVEIKWGGAMEHSTVTSLPTYFFTGENQYETLMVHELAHQWFGDSLTPAVWPDIWLNEGFARYCEALWLEETLGRPAYAEFMYQIGPLFHENMFVGDGLLADPDPILPNILVYDKGAWLLHSLRLLLGDDDFFTLFKNYAMAPDLVHQTTTTADFIQMAEQQAGRNLSRFFEPWLNTETVPRLHSEIELNADGQPGKVRLRFQQLQDVWVEMAIPVVGHCGTSEWPTVLTINQRQKEFELNWDCPVDSVSIDPESLVFMEKALASAPFMAVVGPWPNPIVSTGADFRINLLGNSEMYVNMFNVRGQKVFNENIGIVEATGSANEPGNTPYIWHFSTAKIRGLAAGVYWMEFLGSGHRVVRKMTIIH